MDIQSCHQFQGRLGMLMIVIQSVLLLAVATSVPQKNSEENLKSYITGCLPCSETFLVKSYFEKHNSLVDSDFEAFLAKEFPFSDSCQLPQHDISDMLELSIPSRHLTGQGSHRHLVTSIRFDVHTTMPMLDTELCEAVLIERLPAGVFADPFELQHLVQRSVLLNAAVFGDSNLELPSALSNRSVVEIHKNTWKYTSSEQLIGFEYTFEIPLHARYQPLDSKGYSRVVMGQPDIMLRCTPRKLQHKDCSSLLLRWNVWHASDIAWQMPCGNDELTRFVDVVTFASALVSALLIVTFSMCYSSAIKDFKNV